MGEYTEQIVNYPVIITLQLHKWFHNMEIPLVELFTYTKLSLVNQHV